MKLLKTAVVGLGLVALAGCSTTTYRSVQEMELGNGDFIIKYGETVVTRDPFSHRVIADNQKFAECKKVAGSLECKSLPITIDGTPLVDTIGR